MTASRHSCQVPFGNSRDLVRVGSKYIQKLRIYLGPPIAQYQWMPTPPNKTQTTLSDLPLQEQQAIRLRGVLKRALQEAMAIGVGLGIGVGVAACGSDPISGPTGGTAGVPGSGGQGGQAGGGQGGKGVAPTICQEAQGLLGCDPQQVMPDFARFRPTKSVSYWATGRGRTIQLEHGRSCANEAQPQECQSEINDAISQFVRPPSQIPDGGCEFGGCDPGESFLLAKSEQGITIMKTAEALAQFLAPIDTVAEASAVAQYFSASSLECSDKRSGVTCDGDAFTVVAFQAVCSGTDSWLKIKVPHSGAAPTTEVIETKRSGCAIGRIPDGCDTQNAPQARWGSLAEFWSECAGLEAASIPAFHMLAEDLRRLNAPHGLIAEALSSAEDETRHAAVVFELAARAGGTSQDVRVPRRAPKSLFDMAHENAVEGCVRETFGAFVAAYQAQAASDPRAKAVFARIAEDELKHAALSHAIATWAGPQLSDGERALIDRDRSQLIAQLRRATATQHAPEVYEAAGYPSGSVALRMLDVLETNVWS
ncbi:MAG: ferritin-like domain-containing protein [Deltaproteobacteria bacterium]|nr:ferritin-like domain-containing protein [Deltaproteobacteria bacterium]